jgi:hypothetical protein
MLRAGLLCLAVSLELVIGAILFSRYAPWFLGALVDPFEPASTIGKLYGWAIGITLLCGLFLTVAGLRNRIVRKARARGAF